MNYLSVCIYVLIVCRNVQVQSVEEEEDDFDGVTVEEEEVTDDNNKGIDVPYESPVPSDTSAVYLAEHFDVPQLVDKRWVRSQAKKEGIDEEIAKYDGVWRVEAPKKDGLKGDLGLVLKSKAKHAAIAARLDRPFNFRNNRPLIVQYEVTLQEGQECGGAYLKLLSDGPDTRQLAHFHDKTPYSIMFGPDKCGNEHKLHFIFKHRNPLNGSLEEKHCKKPKERLEDVFKDKLPHLYTLVLKPDNRFEVWLDRRIVNHGNLLEDFTPPVNPPAEIDDPTDQKPVDWDEQEKIPDPTATKPDDWDESAPATIVDPEARRPDGWLEDELPMVPDPDAKQPDDWDAEMDGEWEPPLIDNPVCRTAVGCGAWEPPVISNPAYRGKWRAPLIDNPNYRGKWRPRRIPNPDYFQDLYPFYMAPIAAVGFELWSMSPDILFDNLIITDQLAVAEAWAAGTFELKRQKIARDSSTWWGRVMKAINYKPGWWALYFVYCTIPIAIYVWYIRKRVLEESFIQRMLLYTEEYPWLWLVYVVAVGLPIVLVVYCCCRLSDKQDKQPRRSDEDKDEPDKEDAEQYDAAAAAVSKKTDAYTKDDEPKEGADNEKDSSDVEEKEILLDDEPERASDDNDNGTGAGVGADTGTGTSTGTGTGTGIDTGIDTGADNDEDDAGEIENVSSGGDAPRKRKLRKD